MRLIKACSALAAFAVIFVIPSMASASITLTHPTGTVAPVGTSIVGTNVAHGTETKTDIVLTTALGNIACTKATVTGKILVNNGTHVLGTVETAEVGGTKGITTTGHCSGEGFIGSTVTPTPSHTSDDMGGGKKSLPWCITAGPEDKFELWGEVEGSCTNGKTRPVTFTLHGTLTCGYEKAVVTGTYTTHLSSDAVLTLKQTFNRRAGESAFCPATGTLDMAFTLTAETEPNVEGPAVWIDK
jgi:hypothetical protein